MKKIFSISALLILWTLLLSGCMTTWPIVDDLDHYKKWDTYESIREKANEEEVGEGKEKVENEEEEKKGIEENSEEIPVETENEIEKVEEEEVEAENTPSEEIKVEEDI